MSILFVILIIIASVVMGLLILIQNPKGGGLAGNIAGFNSQFMGVKQTTDVLEKGTWVMVVIIAVLSLFSSFFISRGNTESLKDPNIRPNSTQSAPANQPAAPANSVPLPTTPAK